MKMILCKKNYFNIILSNNAKFKNHSTRLIVKINYKAIAELDFKPANANSAPSNSSCIAKNGIKMTLSIP